MNSRLRAYLKATDHARNDKSLIKNHIIHQVPEFYKSILGQNKSLIEILIRIVGNEERVLDIERESAIIEEALKIYF